MKKFGIGAGIVVGALILVLVILSMFVVRIPSGHVGVVYSTSGVQDETLDTGWDMIGFFDKVIEYPVKMQTKNYETIAVSTKDGKNINLDMAVNYNVDPTKAVSLFNKFGAVSVDSIEDGYLKTRLRDSARQVIAKYSVIDIYGEKSSEASGAIQKAFSEDVEDLGFIIENLTLGVPSADESTQKAIDERIKASQELEKKKTELEIAKAEAERLKVEAQGRAESYKIISNSITPELLKKWEIDARNKHGWVTVQGSGGVIVDK